jgi:hypothetical protein
VILKNRQIFTEKDLSGIYRTFFSIEGNLPENTSPPSLFTSITVPNPDPNPVASLNKGVEDHSRELLDTSYFVFVADKRISVCLNQPSKFYRRRKVQ